MVKNLPANVGDMDLITRSGRSLGERSATHSGILAREIPWKKEPGRVQSMRLRESDTI